MDHVLQGGKGRQPHAGPRPAPMLFGGNSCKSRRGKDPARKRVPERDTSADTQIQGGRRKRNPPFLLIRRLFEGTLKEENRTHGNQTLIKGIALTTINRGNNKRRVRQGASPQLVGETWAKGGKPCFLGEGEGKRPEGWHNVVRSCTREEDPGTMQEGKPTAGGQKCCRGKLGRLLEGTN